MDERSVLIASFFSHESFSNRKKKLKMISCTYSLPLHEELNFSRPLGILKSEKKMIGHKILLNNMRASSPWDAGWRENAQRGLFTFVVVFPVRSD